jgi:NSS family neurotransmitter:Na+ symporter
MGGVVAIFFFVALLLAALTSGISILEVIVAFCMEEFKMKRKVAVALTFLLIWVLGCLCIVSSKVFSLFEFLSAECLMLIGGLLVVLFAGWKLGRKAVFEELTNDGDIKLSPRMFETLLFLIRFVAPVALLAIAVFQIHE